MNETPRRLLLRVAVKLFALSGLLVVAAMLLLSVQCSPTGENTRPILHHQVQASAAQPLERIAWAGGNVLVLYRDSTLVASLETPHPELADPASHGSRQPDNLPVLRAWHEHKLVLFDRGETGCPLEWLPPGHRQPPFQPWQGGFRDICHNSWYDAAGRAYTGGRSAGNIPIPPHHWRGENVLILGAHGDNSPTQP
jgi:ubiquinol-cytochrome c reductase iron-sulfur subunit